MFNLIEFLYLRQKGNLVYYDSLTGARSRQYYDMEAKVKYHGKDVLVAFVDVNNLKQVNDNCGHHVGSALLCRIANDLMNISGKKDVCRIGGDEFVIIGEFDASLLQSVAGISYGVHCKEKYEDMSSAVKKADENMYKHKATTRRKRV